MAERAPATSPTSGSRSSTSAATRGVRFAFEVHPGQIAFDLYSAEMVLDALDGREEFGFTFDPSHLHWQGVDPVEFLRRFADRIYHVHVKDVALTLNGRTGLLGSYLPPGDPRRGWESRSPGHGGIDWEAVDPRPQRHRLRRARCRSTGSDPGMDRERRRRRPASSSSGSISSRHAWFGEHGWHWRFRGSAIGMQESVTGGAQASHFEDHTMVDIEPRHEALKRQWTDQYVEVNPERPELTRFAGIVGRVVTVNYNGKAIVDFQDGGWYDITASTEFLRKLDPAEAKGKYDAKNVNSAQPLPDKQGYAAHSMILLIDNYDSFTYNLVQRLGELDPDIRRCSVYRNDQITADQVAALKPTHIIISPGPVRRARPASPTT